MATGAVRWIWNFLILVGVVAVTIGSVYMAHKKAGWYGPAAIAAFILLAVIVGAIQKAKKKAEVA